MKNYASKLKNAVYVRVLDKWVMVWNYFHDLFALKHSENFSQEPMLREIQKRALIRNDICDHLTTIFLEGTESNPRLIVELGVRGGESNYVLERVAKKCGSEFLSVDLNDCSKVCDFPQWHFVKSDDISFGEIFNSWCQSRGIIPSIDLLFIDTSHEYEHTKAEISTWFKYLSPFGKVIFHDTNLRPLYGRNDGSIGLGWDNKRGVIRAVEEFFNNNFKEKQNFEDSIGNWSIKHYSNCNGLTILKKI